VSLQAGTSQLLVFRVDAQQASRVQARLTVDGHDALKSDNTAFLDLPVGRDLFVYCPASLATYRHALSQMPGILVEPDAKGAATLASYDLVITDLPDDLNKEAATFLLVGAAPADLQTPVTTETG